MNRRAAKVVLLHCEAFSMVDDWIDHIELRRDAHATFASLRQGGGWGGFACDRQRSPGSRAGTSCLRHHGQDSDVFRARHQDMVRAAGLLQDAVVQRSDFRCALDNVGTGDLVFLDPPYLYGDDQVDQQSYNVDRFGVANVRFLAQEMRRLVDLGAYVIFCWGERADALVPDGGNWADIGRDYVWLSEGLVLPTEIANDKADRPADRHVNEEEFQ